MKAINKNKKGATMSGYLVTQVPTKVVKCSCPNNCTIPGFHKMEDRGDGTFKQVKFHKVLGHTLYTPLV